jgi:pyruvate dehydrogenase E1 component beta subunit
VSLGLLEEFGEDRIRDTPLSESAFVGAGIGAALGGMLPIVEVMTVNFSMLAMDQLVNTTAAGGTWAAGSSASRSWYGCVPGAGRQLAAQHSHSHSPENVSTGSAPANEALRVAQRILPAALLLKAAALAVHEVPEVNGFHLDGRFTRSTSVQLGSPCRCAVAA